jgi:hypothetical protein
MSKVIYKEKPVKEIPDFDMTINLSRTETAILMNLILNGIVGKTYPDGATKGTIAPRGILEKLYVEMADVLSSRDVKFEGMISAIGRKYETEEYERLDRIWLEELAESDIPRMFSKKYNPKKEI